ncbi:MAG: Gfo/Idh/MocA family oxidoreductase [Anaerolineae bacterium]
MVKAAVIGVGSMGRHHARVYREMETVQLVGVADTNPVAGTRVAGLYGVPHFADYREMLDAVRPEVVSLALPTSLHFRVACELVDRGIHVLIEKPITSTVEQASELIALAEQRGVVVSVGHIERFNPVIVELRNRLERHELGPIYKVHMQRLSPYPNRIQDAGVVVDLASHDIDLMRHLIHEPILRIYGETLMTINSEREDAFSGLIRFKSGLMGVLDVNWITPRKVRNLTITGAGGMFCCDLIAQELLFYKNDLATDQWENLSILRGVSEGNVLGIRIPRYEPLASELADFIEAVQTGRPPLITGADGMETLKLALQFVRSGSEHSILSLEDQTAAEPDIQPA